MADPAPARYRVSDAASLETLVDAVEARLDEIVDAILEAYVAELPSYAAAPPSILDQIRVNTGANIRFCVAILKGETGIETLGETHAELGRVRARQGFPLHEVLLTYHLGTRVFWEKLTEIAPKESEFWPEVSRAAMRLTLELLQQSINVVARAYLEVQNARVADEEHDHQVVVEMLAGIRARDAIYEDRAVRRGIDVDAIESCSVAGMRGNDLSGHVQSLRRMLPRAVVGRIGDHIVVFGRGDARLHRPPSLNGLAPIGFARDRAPDVAFRRAEAAFAVAEHLGHGAVAYEEVVPLAMVFEGPPEHRRTFVESQLGPLLNDPLGEDLLRSLEAYYRAGQSIASAARSLHVHRHTLEYRLNRVSALLKTDLREPGRRLFLELALALRPAIN